MIAYLFVPHRDDDISLYVVDNKRKSKKMKSEKLKERIGSGLYVVAIILIFITIYQKSVDSPNKINEMIWPVALIIASIYRFWLYKEKKKNINREL